MEVAITVTKIRQCERDFRFQKMVEGIMQNSSRSTRISGARCTVHVCARIYNQIKLNKFLRVLCYDQKPLLRKEYLAGPSPSPPIPSTAQDARQCRLTQRGNA